MIYPEENIARRLVKRHNLTPPYDLHRLVAYYATLQEIAFPPEMEIDGISIGLGGERQPVILINSNRVATRKKFTLAHELGHVMIPWHTGTIVSENPEIVINANMEYSQMETEANRFAAELLMPSIWLNEIFLQEESMQCALNKILLSSGTSFEATLIKIFKELEESVILLEYNLSGQLLKHHRSRKELTPDITSFDIDDLDGLDFFNTPFTYEKFSIKDKKFYCWRFKNSHFVETDPRDWKELLNDIVQCSTYVNSENINISQSLNSTLAAKYQKYKKSGDVNEICSKIIRSFLGVDKFSGIYDHPLINDYVIKRVRELLGKDAKKIKP